uniref:Carboxylesterase 5A-like n=1 Tax=Phallusia mammillata TaxID=59560 RepID=A0A6F9D9W1_9ASCI|nr:carboxylesterase 5A-like [Phallusia mammillata]
MKDKKKLRFCMMRDDLSEPVKLILDELKITATEPEEIVKQLKAMDAKKITKALDSNAEKKMLVPTVDGKFHPKNTQKLLEEGKYNPVPYIIGFNNTEGAGMLGSNFTEDFPKGLSEETAKSIISGMLAEGIPADKLESVNKAVTDFYSKQLDDGDKYKWSKVVASYFGDSFFIVPSIGQAIAHSGAGHDTYVYYMTQQPRMHHDDAYAGKIKPKAVFCEADHGDDIMLTMGYPLMNCKFIPQAGFSDTEKKLSKQWMKTICQFAKTGNPNCDGEKEWPKYDTKKFLELKWPYDVRTDIFEKRFKFWSEKIPALLK